MLRLPVERPERVVLPAQAIGQDLRFRSCGEHLDVEALTREPAVPGAVEGRAYNLAKSFSQGIVARGAPVRGTGC